MAKYIATGKISDDDTAHCFGLNEKEFFKRLKGISSGDTKGLRALAGDDDLARALATAELVNVRIENGGNITASDWSLTLFETSKVLFVRGQLPASRLAAGTTAADFLSSVSQLGGPATITPARTDIGLKCKSDSTNSYTGRGSHHMELLTVPQAIPYFGSIVFFPASYWTWVNTTAAAEMAKQVQVTEWDSGSGIVTRVLSSQASTFAHNVPDAGSVSYTLYIAPGTTSRQPVCDFRLGKLDGGFDRRATGRPVPFSLTPDELVVKVWR